MLLGLCGVINALLFFFFGDWINFGLAVFCAIMLCVPDKPKTPSL